MFFPMIDDRVMRAFGSSCEIVMLSPATFILLSTIWIVCTISVSVTSEENQPRGGPGHIDFRMPILHITEALSHLTHPGNVMLLL